MSQLSGSVFAGEDMRRDEEVKGSLKNSNLFSIMLLAR
jgi:hypothetical protein